MDALALAEAHRLRQTRAAVPLMRVVQLAASSLSPADLEGSFASVARVALPVIAAGRTQSGAISLDYYRAARIVAEVPESDFPLVAPDPVDVEQITTSLHATGPGYAKGAIARGIPAADAVRTAEAAIVRAALRHVLNGGRSAITRATAADPHARGWSRVSDGKPCHFCAMLVSRGPVYTEATVRFRSHDGCGCGVAAVFKGQDGWTPQARAIRDLYDANPGTDFRSAWAKHLAEAGPISLPAAA